MGPTVHDVFDTVERDSQLSQASQNGKTTKQVVTKSK